MNGDTMPKDVIAEYELAHPVAELGKHRPFSLTTYLEQRRIRSRRPGARRVQTTPDSRA